MNTIRNLIHSTIFRTTKRISAEGQMQIILIFPYCITKNNLTFRMLQAPTEAVHTLRAESIKKPK
jgi:hypothetical protein